MQPAKKKICIRKEPGTGMSSASFFSNKSKEGGTFKGRILSCRSFSYNKQGKQHTAISVVLFLEDDINIPHVVSSQEETKAINKETLKFPKFERKRPPIELKKGQTVFITSFNSPEDQQLEIGSLVQAEGVSFGININKTSNYMKKKREDFKGSKDLLTEEEKDTLMYEEVLVRVAGHPTLAINGRIILLEGPSYEKCSESFKTAVINLDYLRQERLPYISKMVEGSSENFNISEFDQKIASLDSANTITEQDIVSVPAKLLLSLGNISGLSL